MKGDGTSDRSSWFWAIYNQVINLIAGAYIWAPVMAIILSVSALFHVASMADADVVGLWLSVTCLMPCGAHLEVGVVHHNHLSSISSFCMLLMGLLLRGRY